MSLLNLGNIFKKRGKGKEEEDKLKDPERIKLAKHSALISSIWAIELFTWDQKIEIKKIYRLLNQISEEYRDEKVNLAIKVIKSKRKPSGKKFSTKEKINELNLILQE